MSEVGMGKEPDGGVGERGKEEKGEGGGNLDHIYCIGYKCALPKRNVPSPTPPVVTKSKKGGIGQRGECMDGKGMDMGKCLGVMRGRAGQDWEVGG